MKILVLANKLSFPMKPDCDKARDFFNKHIPLEFTFRETSLSVTVKEYKQVQGFNSQTGKPTMVKYMGLVDGVKDQVRNLVKENEADIVVFAWDMNSLPIVGDEAVTSWTNFNPLYPDTEYIQVAVSKFKFDTQDIWKTLTHEIMHALFMKLAKKGVALVDPMDSWKAPNDYVENDNPYSPTGNHSEALRRLAPYKAILSPKLPSTAPLPRKWDHFTEAEVKGLKNELVEKLDKARDLAGIPFVLTSTLRDPAKNEAVGGVQNSAHIKGEAVDIRCRNGRERWQIVNALIYVGFKRIGISFKGGFVHADIAKDLPQPVIWGYED